MQKAMVAKEGKTKIVTPGPIEGTVILVTKDELTGGDAAKRVEITGIAQHKTEQATNVFELLKQNGIPTAFVERDGETTMLCDDCDMLPLELVTRRFAFGSFLKREPSYAKTGKPQRFDNVRHEFFHKWAVVMPPLVNRPTQMDEGEARELYLRDGKWADGVFTDPFVHIDNIHRWLLFPPKARFDVRHPLMKIDEVCSEEERKFVIEKLMLPCFATLEQAWSKIVTASGPVALGDIKIEVGRRKRDGQIVIADVIDNDSWRIWPGGDPTKQLDKQCFRDGSPLGKVSDNYALVAELTRQFR